MTSRATGDYLPTGDDAEMQRLRLQAQVWQPAAKALLDTLEIAPGSRALDLGCGAMGVLDALSQRVGPSGTVVGLDSDPIQLAAARLWPDDGNRACSVLIRSRRHCR